MIFQNLEVRNFRNFEKLKLSFSPRLNIFLGENGQGKTNILEALYTLTNKDSFRYVDNFGLIRYEQEQSVLSSRIVQTKLSFEWKKNDIF